MADTELKVPPLPSVRRLPTYLRLLYEHQAQGRQVISCTHIADDLGLVSVQVRKDLAITGIIGKPKVGYQIGELIAAIEEFLGWNNTRDAFLVGVGCLGAALLAYEGFAEFNLKVLAGFDIDPAKIGTQINGKQIFAMEKLPNLVKRMHVLIGILTVPATAAQTVADAMIRSGIRAIWNYTPAQLRVPDCVVVEDVKLAASLAALSSRLADSLRKQPTKNPKAKTPAAKETGLWNKNSSASPTATGARRFAKVCDILDRHRRNPSRLIPILQEVQGEYRYLPEEVLTFVATSLGLPPARVFGVATFFSHFTLKPRGKYTIRLCDGTACHVRDSIAILDALHERLKLTAKQNTTPDMLFTVETVSCLGACGLAPVIVINDDVHGPMTPAKAVDLVDGIIAKENAS